jgi:hypothetical protein
VKQLGAIHKRFAHPRVAKIMPGVEGVQSLKASIAISDEHKHASPSLPKKKLDLRIRKESFASEDSTNESLSCEESANLSPKSKMNRDLASDYGSSIE